jgi:hypothetical protein
MLLRLACSSLFLIPPPTLVRVLQLTQTMILSTTSSNSVTRSKCAERDMELEISKQRTRFTHHCMRLSSRHLTPRYSQSSLLRLQS